MLKRSDVDLQPDCNVTGGTGRSVTPADEIVPLCTETETERMHIRTYIPVDRFAPP